LSGAETLEWREISRHSADNAPLNGGGRERRRRAKDRFATGVVWGAFGVALVPLVWLLWTVASKGISAVAHAGWWTSDQTGITKSINGGGALAAIVGTLEQVALCTLISVPVAVLVGVYLVEYGRGPLARITTFMVDILTGVPSIVAALFVYALFIGTFGYGRSGALVSFSLVLLMIPVVIRATEEMLRLVPDELREAAYALGIPKWKTVLRVVLPTALSGVVTGVVLGIARVAGETAPLLVLVGYAGTTNTDLFGGFQGSLPGFINAEFIDFNTSSGATAYHLDANGNRVAGAVANYAPDRMWGAALTLIVLVLVLNLVARLISRRTKLAP